MTTITPDVSVRDEGTVVAFQLLTEAAHEWVTESVDSSDWQWMGKDTLVVDHRFAAGLIIGMRDAGLRVLD